MERQLTDTTAPLVVKLTHVKCHQRLSKWQRLNVHQYVVYGTVLAGTSTDRKHSFFIEIVKFA